jgi:predicted hydrocarbon binding protein
MAADSSPSAEAIKGTMLQARIAWVRERFDHAALERLRGGVDPRYRGLIDRPPLATDWIPLEGLLSIDVAIASVAGGTAEEVHRALGHYSATMNLGGVYKAFAVEEPHRFFEQQALLHRRFQNFGTAHYERGGLQSGRMRIEGYAHPSPVFCASGRGYFEGALEMMKVPGPIRCTEVLCQCAGDPSCLFDLSW